MLTQVQSIKLGQATNIVKDEWISHAMHILTKPVEFEAEVIQMYVLLMAIEDKVTKMEKGIPFEQTQLDLSDLQ